VGFSRLQLGQWRQFSEVDISFHPQLTIITGANGAGKSTILNILGQNIGAFRPYLGSPKRMGGSRSYVSGIFHFPHRLISWLRPKQDPNWSDVGFIHYENGHQSSLQVPTQGAQTYNLQITQQQNVIGFHMPSHRSVTNYRPIPNMNFGGMKPESAFGSLIGEAYSVFHGNRSDYSVLFRLKELLANWAVFGEGNSSLGRDQAQKDAYDGFVEILKKLLPEDLGFVSLRIDAPDIIVQTHGGDFLIDALSGGLTSIIEVAALIYTRTLATDVPDGRFVVTMDEPENHLHPAIQRSILSSFVRAFPKVQFIVATHSPFIVSSSKDAKVYALKYEDAVVEEDMRISGVEQQNGDMVIRSQSARKVKCIYLDQGHLTTSPSEILREVLGVPVTFPVWVEDSLEAIVANYRDRPFNEQTLADLRRDMAHAGLSHLFPEAALNLGQTN
jgi:hypothetical protein